MARLPRVVIPGISHHITQRGNRRKRVFFEDADYKLYVDVLSEAANEAQTAIWDYCLMPNHVHIIAVPQWLADMETRTGMPLGRKRPVPLK